MNWIELSKKIAETCREREIPFYGCFEITPLCNFHCNMCYIRLDPQQARNQGGLLSSEQWIHLAEEAKTAGTLALEITGGEAVTRPDFQYIYESLIKMGFLINLRTNAYLLSGERLELLKKYKPHRIGITLYGASNETYQAVCGVDDGFSVVTRNILEMRKAGLDIRLAMTLTNDNFKDREALNDWAKQNEFAIPVFAGLFSPRSGTNRSIEGLQISVPEKEYTISNDMKFQPHRIENRDFYMNPFWMCRGFGSMFCISWDGRMTLCNAMTAISTDPLSIGFTKAYHELYRKLKNLRRPRECETCKYIDFCASCPTHMVTATGNPERTSDEVCKNARRAYKHFLIVKDDNAMVDDAISALSCQEGGN